MTKQCLLFLSQLLAGALSLCAQNPAHQYPADKLLIIVDSVVIENRPDLDPNDIDSLTILKGSEAIATAALYGKTGTSGVVLIKTKRPKINIPVTQFLSLRGITITAHTLVMIDNHLVNDPEQQRIDTSGIVLLAPADLSKLSYLDSTYKRLQVIKIVRKTPRAPVTASAQGTGSRPVRGALKKQYTPAGPSSGFRNLQIIRSATSLQGKPAAMPSRNQPIYIRGYTSLNPAIPL